MDRRERFQEKLKAARKAKGWTYYMASQHMRKVRPQQLQNLEGEGDSPQGTDPTEIKARTMLELIRAFWPSLNLDDFAGPGCLLRVTPRDQDAVRKLKGYETVDS